MRWAATTLIAVTTFHLVGCGSPAPAPVAANTTSAITSSSAATTSPPPSTSTRGLLVKAIGQPAHWATNNNVKQATFVVDAVQVDPKCTGEFSKPAERGHLVVLSFTVTTTPDYRADQLWSITAHDFSIVGPDGVTESSLSTGPAFSCLRNEEYLPTEPYATGSKYIGKIVLDTRNASGVVTYRSPAIGLQGGWEWQIPTS